MVWCLKFLEVFVQHVKFCQILMLIKSSNHWLLGFSASCFSLGWQATTPPPAEWNVPHDGPIDKSFSVTAAPELAKKAEEKAEEKDDDDEDEEEEEEEDDHQQIKCNHLDSSDALWYYDCQSGFSALKPEVVSSFLHTCRDYQLSLGVK